MLTDDLIKLMIIFLSFSGLSMGKVGFSAFITRGAYYTWVCTIQETLWYTYNNTQLLFHFLKIQIQNTNTCYVVWNSNWFVELSFSGNVAVKIIES